MKLRAAEQMGQNIRAGSLNLSPLKPVGVHKCVLGCP